MYKFEWPFKPFKFEYQVRPDNLGNQLFNEFDNQKQMTGNFVFLQQSKNNLKQKLNSKIS